MRSLLLALCIALAGGLRAAVPLRDPRISGDSATVASGTLTIQSGATLALASGAIFDAADPISLANGGLGVALSDPGADRLLFWDDSAGSTAWLTLGSGLSISTTTLNATAAPLTATATLDFGSIAAAASATLTITVTGATTGQAVALGLPAAPAAGIVFFGFVSAADTVTVRAMNITASAVDPASATYRATVLP